MQDNDNNTELDYKIFNTADDGIKFAFDNFKINLKERFNNNAPKELQQNNGENPSIEYLLKRRWGLSTDNKIRMIPTNDNKWLVYWK